MSEQSKVVGKVMIPFEITQDFVNDILCAAFEGGTGYWGKFEEMSGKCIKNLPNYEVTADFYAPEGFRYRFYDAVDGAYFDEKDQRVHPVLFEGQEGYENYKDLTLATFISGFEMYLANGGNPYGSNTEAENFDADEADKLIQYAVFGEQIFG